ncbi:DUF4126 domain-containing protein [bacterium]|nr:DUF4126 domain-containing protein [bacterium]
MADLTILASLATAVGITAGASLRAFTTLFIVCALNSAGIIEFITYGTWEAQIVNWPYILPVLLLAAIMESVWECTPLLSFLDSAIISIITRPLAVIMCSLATLNLGSYKLNMLASIIMGLCLCGPMILMRKSLLRNSFALNEKGYLRPDVCIIETLAAAGLTLLSFVLPFAGFVLFIAAVIVFYYKYTSAAKMPAEFNLHNTLDSQGKSLNPDDAEAAFSDIRTQPDKTQPHSFAARYNTDGAPPAKTSSRRL